jgi:hypothetical protein
VVTPVSTGKQKQASTGSPKTEKGSSTGSPKLTKKGLLQEARKLIEKGSSTGSPKTGSPKSEKKGPSTRSPEKAKRKEREGWYSRKGGSSCAGRPQYTSKAKGEEREGDPSTFEARRSKRIKTGKPQPPPSSQTITGDVPTSPSERSPSKTSATPERGSPKITTWTRRIGQSASEARLKVKEKEEGRKRHPHHHQGQNRQGHQEQERKSIPGLVLGQGQGAGAKLLKDEQIF